SRELHGGVKAGLPRPRSRLRTHAAVPNAEEIMAMESVNPATGQVIATFEELTDAELDARLERAEAAFRRYRETTYAQRAERLARLADLLEGRAEELGRLMTEEMGKPIGAAVAEAKKCALACRYYVEHGEEHLADEPVEVGGARAYIRHLPIGPVLAIMPWNFPFWQVIRFAAPAMMAGNVGLLKHASNVPRCALKLEELFLEAGFEEGVFQTLLVGSDRVAR